MSSTKAGHFELLAFDADVCEGHRSVVYVRSITNGYEKRGTNVPLYELARTIGRCLLFLLRFGCPLALLRFRFRSQRCRVGILRNCVTCDLVVRGLQGDGTYSIAAGASPKMELQLLQVMPIGV